jgi:hypothetical protein
MNDVKVWFLYTQSDVVHQMDIFYEDIEYNLVFKKDQTFFIYRGNDIIIYLNNAPQITPFNVKQKLKSLLNLMSFK